jgi:2-dehydro-3-deoxygluconokinase
MGKVLTFGELLIRLQGSSSAFINDGQIEAFVGGSELNVAMTLSSFKIPTCYCTAIPDNTITKNIISILEKNNIDTSKIYWQGERIGTYYLLSANGLTEGDVIYDRNFSSFSQLIPEDINWDLLFEGCSWFHWTAITPALSKELAYLMKKALEQAAQREIFISVDLNYRSKLWCYGLEPIKVMPELVEYCDCIMGNIWAENRMLGTSIDTTLNRYTLKEDYITHASAAAAELFLLFPKCRHIANTFRFMDNPQHNLFYGTYHTPKGNYSSGILETNKVIDRIGSGDAFMGGLICGIYKGYQPLDIINLATNTGFKKLFVKGDFMTEIL